MQLVFSCNFPLLYVSTKIEIPRRKLCSAVIWLSPCNVAAGVQGLHGEGAAAALEDERRVDEPHGPAGVPPGVLVGGLEDAPAAGVEGGDEAGRRGEEGGGGEEGELASRSPFVFVCTDPRGHSRRTTHGRRCNRYPGRPSAEATAAVGEPCWRDNGGGGQRPVEQGAPLLSAVFSSFLSHSLGKSGF